MTSLIAAPRTHDETARRLARPGDFDLPDEAEALARLREVALVAGQDHVLVFTPQNEPYDPLFQEP